MPKIVSTSAVVIGYLRGLLDEGKLSDAELKKLKPKELLVLMEMAANTDPDTLEFLCPDKVLARRTAMSVSSVRRVLQGLEQYREEVRYGPHATKVWKLKLPGLAPGVVHEDSPAPEAPFDVLSYVTNLQDPVCDVPAEKVRRIIEYHWRSNSDSYWRSAKGNVTSAKRLRAVIKIMERQYDERPQSNQVPKTIVTPSKSYTPQPAYTPEALTRKGQRVG